MTLKEEALAVAEAFANDFPKAMQSIIDTLRSADDTQVRGALTLLVGMLHTVTTRFATMATDK
jgi:hypothetical protein